MAQQTAADAHGDGFVAPLQREGREQIGDDVVVVAGIERDAIFGTRLEHAAHHVERAVAVEGRDLDGDDVVDFGETAPEIGRQGNTAAFGQQVEAKQRDFLGHPLAVLDDLGLRHVLPGGQAEQPGVVAQPHRRAGLAHRLFAAAGEAGDHQHRPLGPVRHGLGGAAQHGLIEPVVADGELGGVDADGQAADAGIEVVAAERSLAAEVDLAFGVERQGMGRNDAALPQHLHDLGGNIRFVLAHDDVLLLKGKAFFRSDADNRQKRTGVNGEVTA